MRATDRTQTVLVRGANAARVLDRVRTELPTVTAVVDADGHEPADINIVAGHVSDAELHQLTSLEWVHSWAAGVDADVGYGLRASGLTVTSSAGNGAVPLAEHAMMLMLLLNRDARRWLGAQSERRWDRFTHQELCGKTVGIYGFGNLGRELAIRSRAFGMRVIGLRRDVAKDEALVDEMFSPERILDFASECDVLVIAAPLTAETEGSIDEAVLDALPSNACVVVMSRGGIVNDASLLKALQAGTLSAGLDAHAIEPLPVDSPYWALPNAIVTPHNGATTPETAERGIQIFIDNLRRRLSGYPLHNVVDLGGLAQHS